MNKHNILLNIPAILWPPTVVSLTTLAVDMEIQGPNGSATYMNVEYALEEFGSVLNFQQGTKVKVVNGRNTYRLSQQELMPARTYHIRVVPFVVLYPRRLYKGIPSNTTQVMTPAPGKVISFDLHQSTLPIL